MASLITVRLNKGDSPNLGFRLQGGKDFGTPLVVQKVNVGSPAERAGLIAGDSVIKINNTDVFNLRHKDAQDVVVRAGPAFEITLQRGGSTWKPSVVPTGSFPTPSPVINNISPVTRTSLASQRTENIGAIGTGHNLAAKPFSPQVNGINGGPKLVNKQYNSPVKLYSEQSIAETLSAQTEVLSTGALGVNFKKNEKNYDASNSAVLRMLKEAESEPKTHEDEPDSGVVTNPNSGIAGLRHVKAPETRPAPSNPQLPPGQNICAECERLIVGVFVRIKEKNLHVECFKCSTCGSSLKNVGYYNINNKLYCDIHAKSAAIRSNASPSLVPVTVPPGGKAPLQTISSALYNQIPNSPSALSPKLNNSFAPSYQSPSLSGPKPFSSVYAPSKTAPLSPAPASQNVLPSYNAPSYNAPSYNAPSYSPASSAGRSVQGIIWPPPQEPDVPTACPLFYPPPSQVEQIILTRRAEKEAELESNFSECQEIEEINTMAQFYPKMCSEEAMNITELKSAVDCIETISETLETQKLVENILKTRPQSPPSIEADITTTELPRPNPKPESVLACPILSSETVCCQRNDNCDLKRPTQFTPNTVECQLPSRIENATPQKWESPLTQAIRTTAPDPDTFAQIPSKHSSSALASALSIAPAKVFTPAMDTGKPVPLPEETVPYFPPEHPVIPEEPKEPNAKPERPKSKFVKALETAPERPFTPVAGTPPLKKKPKDPNDKYFEDIPKPHEKLSMRTALTTAPERPYSPLIVESAGIEAAHASEQNQSTARNIDRSQFQKPLKPDVLPASFQMNKKDTKPPSYYSPAILYQRTEESKTEERTEETDSSNTRTIERQTIHNPQVTQIIVDEAPDNHIAPTFQAISCFYQNKKDNISIEISTTPPVLTPPPKSSAPTVRTVEAQPGYIEKETITEEKRARQQTTRKQEQVKEEIKGEIQAFKQAEEVILKKAVPPVILHKPEGLPAYQVQLSENAEADLLLMEKMQKAQSRLEQQKMVQAQQVNQQQCIRQLERQQQQQEINRQEHQRLQQQEQIIQQQQIRQEQMYREEQQQIQLAQQQQTIKKPIITINPDDSTTRQPQTTFKPVIEDRPPHTTFSPRPGSITPSMINRPPPVLPYYQANLVSQRMGPPSVNLLDPTSPAVSRSPSPCPRGMRERSRSPSPFPSSAAAAGRDRAVSPAPGPPPNPLTSSERLPTPADSKLTQARESLTSYIPEYKNKRDLIEKVQGTEFYRRAEEGQECQLQKSQMQSSHVEQQRCTELSQTKQAQQSQSQLKIQQGAQPTQMYVSQVQTQTFPIQQQMTTQYESIVSEKQDLQQQSYQAQSLEVQEARRAEKYFTQTGQDVSASISEQSRQAHLEQVNKSQCQSVERSADGLTQVQRKKIVTEEYERTQKEVNMQIEKNVTTTKKYPFHDVNAPSVEGPTANSHHRTNPQPLTCSMAKTLEKINQQKLQQSQAQQQSTTQQSCEKSCQRSCQQICQGSSQQTAQLSSNSSKSQTAPAPTKHVFAPSSLAPVKHVDPPGSAKKPNQNVIGPNVSQPDSGAGGGRQAGGISVAPKRGRGVLNAAAIGGARIPLCGNCNMQIRGPFITALGKIWCPNHFICSTPSCRRPLQDLGFVEERGQLYCEFCFEQYLAPPCSKCGAKIKGDCLKAIGKNFHPECFNCVYCGKLFGNSPFFLEDGSPYCDADWNELFTTKCFACGFPVEAGDRWVEALSNNYHSQCFNCTMCKKNLEGQSFFAKGGRPFCKNHAR